MSMDVQIRIGASTPSSKNNSAHGAAGSYGASPSDESGFRKLLMQRIANQGRRSDTGNVSNKRAVSDGETQEPEVAESGELFVNENGMGETVRNEIGIGEGSGVLLFSLTTSAQNTASLNGNHADTVDYRSFAAGNGSSLLNTGETKVLFQQDIAQGLQQTISGKPGTTIGQEQMQESFSGVADQIAGILKVQEAVKKTGITGGMNTETAGSATGSMANVTETENTQINPVKGLDAQAGELSENFAAENGLRGERMGSVETQGSGTTNTVPQQSPSADVSNQISKEIAGRLKQNGPMEFKMQLEPESLGKIDVALKMNGTQLVIDIVSHSAETHALLAGQIDKLVMSLGLHNVQAESIQVNQNQSFQPVESHVSGANTEKQDYTGQQNQGNQQGTDSQGKGHGQTGAQSDLSETAELLQLLRYQSGRMDYAV